MTAPSMSLLQQRISDVEDQLRSYQNRMSDRQVHLVNSQLRKARECTETGDAEGGIAALEETRGVFTDARHML